MDKLMENEKKMVEENLDVVRIVILTQFRYDNNVIGLNYEELFQVGCLGLCEAAKKYNSKTKFTTFASVVVRNKLLTYCKQTNNVNYKCTNSDFIEITDNIDYNSNLDEDLIFKALDKAKLSSNGVALKGIIAIELKVKGLSGSEIADIYDTSTNNVSAWISRAKSKLKCNKEFLKEISLDINS